MGMCTQASDVACSGVQPLFARASEGANMVILGAIIANIFVAVRYGKLAGGLAGLAATTLILLVGIDAYASGDFMALRGAIKLPAAVFYVFIGVYYLVDLGMLAVGLQERAEAAQRNETITAGLDSGLSAADILRKLLAEPGPEETTGEGPAPHKADAESASTEDDGKRETADVASRVLDGLTYEGAFKLLCGERGLSIGQAALRYRNAAELLADRWAELQQAASKTGADLEDVALPPRQVPGVVVHKSNPRWGRKIKPGDVIVSYANRLARDTDTLADIAQRTPADGKVIVHLLRRDPERSEWTAQEPEVSGGDLDEQALGTIANTSAVAAPADPARAGKPTIQARAYRLFTGKDLPEELASIPINAAARVSLVLGIFAILFSLLLMGLLFGPIGILLGLRGKRRAVELNGIGGGMAVAGLVCSIIGLAGSTAMAIVFALAW